MVKRQMRLYDIYRLLVDNEASDINYIYRYQTSDDGLRLMVTYFGCGLTEYYDISTLEDKEASVRIVNKRIKELRHDNIRRQQAVK